jgi:hypothetical protein
MAESLRAEPRDSSSNGVRVNFDVATISLFYPR